MRIPWHAPCKTLWTGTASSTSAEDMVASLAPASIRSRLLSGVFWAIIMSAVGQGTAFVALILSARLLGHEEFGRLAAVQSVVLALAGFATFGLGTTATKFVSELRGQSPERVGRILGVCSLTTFVTGAAFAVGLVIAAPWVARGVLHAAELRGYLQIGALFVFFSALNSYQTGALSGFEAFSQLARVGSVQGPIVLLLTAVMTWWLGLGGALLASALAMLCSWGMHQRVLRAECCRQGVRIRYDHLRKEISVIFHFALPAATSGQIGGLAIVGANAILVRQPGGFAEMAIFCAAGTIRTMVLLAPGIITRVSSPLLCNLWASADSRGYRRAFWSCMAFNGSVTAIAALMLFPAAPFILSLFGDGFAQGGNILRVLLLAAITEVAAVGLFQSVYSQGRMWKALAIQSAWAFFLLAGTWYLTSGNGAIGLAAAYLAAWISSIILYGLELRRSSCGPAAGNVNHQPSTIGHSLKDFFRALL